MNLPNQGLPSQLGVQDNLVTWPNFWLLNKSTSWDNAHKFGGTRLAWGGIWFKSPDIFRPNSFVRLTRMHRQSTTPQPTQKWQIYVVAACWNDSNHSKLLEWFVMRPPCGSLPNSPCPQEKSRAARKAICAIRGMLAVPSKSSPSLCWWYPNVYLWKVPYLRICGLWTPFRFGAPKSSRSF